MPLRETGSIKSKILYALFYGPFGIGKSRYFAPGGVDNVAVINLDRAGGLDSAIPGKDLVIYDAFRSWDEIAEAKAWVMQEANMLSKKRAIVIDGGSMGLWLGLKKRRVMVPRSFSAEHAHERGDYDVVGSAFSDFIYTVLALPVHVILLCGDKEFQKRSYSIGPDLTPMVMSFVGARMTLIGHLRYDYGKGGDTVRLLKTGPDPRAVTKDPAVLLPAGEVPVMEPQYQLDRGGKPCPILEQLLRKVEGG